MTGFLEPTTVAKAGLPATISMHMRRNISRNWTMCYQKVENCLYSIYSPKQGTREIYGDHKIVVRASLTDYRDVPHIDKTIQLNFVKLISDHDVADSTFLIG